MLKAHLTSIFNFQSKFNPFPTCLKNVLTNDASTSVAVDLSGFSISGTVLSMMYLLVNVQLEEYAILLSFLTKRMYELALKLKRNTALSLLVKFVSKI